MRWHFSKIQKSSNIREGSAASRVAFIMLRSRQKPRFFARPAQGAATQLMSEKRCPIRGAGDFFQ
jgi:hypothetical protein